MTWRNHEKWTFEPRTNVPGHDGGMESQGNDFKTVPVNEFQNVDIAHACQESKKQKFEAAVDWICIFFEFIPVATPTSLLLFAWLHGLHKSGRDWPC